MRAEAIAGRLAQLALAGDQAEECLKIADRSIVVAERFRRITGLSGFIDRVQVFVDLLSSRERFFLLFGHQRSGQSAHTHPELTQGSMDEATDIYPLLLLNQGGNFQHPIAQDLNVFAVALDLLELSGRVQRTLGFRRRIATADKEGGDNHQDEGQDRSISCHV